MDLRAGFARFPQGGGELQDGRMDRAADVGHEVGAGGEAVDHGAKRKLRDLQRGDRARAGDARARAADGESSEHERR